MPIFKALKAGPDAAVIRPDFAEYIAVGRQIRGMMAKLTPPTQSLWIDEPVLGLAGTLALHETTIRVTVSIGLAINRLLAKIAADRGKPRGFAILRSEAASVLAQGPVRPLPGIGPALTRRRAAQSITARASSGAE